MFSLTMHMGVKKFAYCLNSHHYDNTQNSSQLILDYSDGETKGLSYTPFLKNPPNFPFYYYLGVKDIKIGYCPGWSYKLCFLSPKGSEYSPRWRLL